ncbi:alpha/beta-hydrolase [Flagelloscypha sp. PMI_526]|nr:alpha/beta-hydrolase [Flagelloscypha sp. PMI_526]
MTSPTYSMKILMIFSLIFLTIPHSLVLASRPAGAHFLGRAPQAGKRIGLNVTLPYGTFLGAFNDTTGVVSFKGIKYAEAPVGDLRFRAPVFPPNASLGFVDVTKYAPSCIQMDVPTVEDGFSEDCLVVNVYLPKGTRTTSQLPVVIYFHGGGFQHGKINAFPPELLLNASEEPFILVVAAYRLGALGFLGGSQIAADGEGNVGLLDQRASMRWVQKFIPSFGGDPEKVSIWGQSAGACSTMFHLIANKGDNEGLFQQAIGDSPCMNYAPEMDSDYAEFLFTQFAGYANCTGNTALKCLREVDISVLAAASVNLLDNRTDVLFPYAPITDGKFIQERPSVAFKAGHFAKVPTLYGSNTDEGWGWWTSLTDPAANVSRSDGNATTIYTFIKGQFPTITPELFEKVLQHYTGSLPDVTAAIYAEMRYICTAKMINGYAYEAGLPAYGYHYDNPDSEGYTRHGDELDAYWNYPQPTSSSLFPAMRRFLTSFIITGKPAIEDDLHDWFLLAANGTQWKSVSSKQGTPRIFLHPGNVTLVDDEGLNERCAFWRSIDDELGR